MTDIDITYPHYDIKTKNIRQANKDSRKYRELDYVIDFIAHVDKNGVILQDLESKAEEINEKLLIIAKQFKEVSNDDSLKDIVKTNKIFRLHEEFFQLSSDLNDLVNNHLHNFYCVAYRLYFESDEDLILFKMKHT